MAKRLKISLLAVAAISAGLCNSLIGAGGGVILSFALYNFLGDSFEDKRNVYVNSQASLIPGCALSCLLYRMSGGLSVRGFSWLVIPAVVGGIAGSLILPRIKVGWIKSAFAILVIWSGYRMIIA